METALNLALLPVQTEFETLADLRFQRDQFSWTSQVFQYTKNGQGRQALKVYKEMREAGIRPSSYTFVAALKACSSVRDVESGRNIHAEVVASGSELNVYVGSMLVDMYTKCGSLVDARRVFEEMPHRNVVTWNAMILGYAQMNEGEEALLLYARMPQQGVMPNDRTFVSALKACSSLATSEDGIEADKAHVRKRCLEQVRGIHSAVLKRRCGSGVFVGTMLVDVYVKCGSLLDARCVFEKMHHRDVVCWTAMILGYAQMEEGAEALQLYARMQQEGVEPDDQTFVAALKACSCLAASHEGNQRDVVIRKQCLEQVRTIHLQAVECGIESAAFVGTMLVDVYAKCGSLVDARSVFDKMPHRDVVPWTAMILGYANMAAGEEALQLFAQMQEEGVIPNDRTYIGALKACSSLAVFLEEGNKVDGRRDKQQCLDQVRVIHSDLLQGGLESDLFVANMLVDAYAKCGSLMDARSVFDRMPHRDVVSWTSIVLGYAQMEDGESALVLYARMQQEGVVPNERTFVAALKACSVVIGLEKGKDVHAQICRSGLHATDTFVQNALIDMYSRCGSMENAQQVFDSLPTRDVVPWTSLIAGYAHQGESQLVFGLFQRMSEEGVRPNGITFLSVLTACRHVGLVELGEQYFEAMSRDYGIHPTLVHYNCMIDLFGRAGQVDKAMQMVKSMPFQPPGDIWRCVLGACRKWGYVELGRQAFDCAVRLDKNDAAAYVLMSNIYSAANMMKDAKDIQAMRLEARAWKKSGQSWWTDIGGIVHAFAVEDREHPEIQEICAELRDLSLKLKEETYVPHPLAGIQ